LRSNPITAHCSGNSLITASWIFVSRAVLFADAMPKCRIVERNSNLHLNYFTTNRGNAQLCPWKEAPRHGGDHEGQIRRRLAERIRLGIAAAPIKVVDATARVTVSLGLAQVLCLILPNQPI